MFKKILIFSALFFLAFAGFAQDYPAKSNTLVTDYTNTLSADEKQRLEDKLVAFDDSTSTQIAVVMMRSIGDYDVNEYATELGRRWGVGHQGKNNGIIVLVAKDDRKLSIQTGYGVEGALPDVITQQIRVNEMNPRFKAGDFYGGLDAGTDAIIKYTKGEYKAEAKPAKSKSNGGSPIGFVVIIVVIILIIIFRKGGGGGSQIIGRRGSASPFWWLLAGSMLNSGRGGGGGSSWGGGGSSGGGGGFGGFGGGSFGGGGSGGSW